MPPGRRTGRMAAATALMVLTLTGACGWIGGQPTQPAPTIGPDQIAALLAAAVPAVEALETQHPDLDIYHVNEHDYSDALLGSKYGALAGVVMYANHDFVPGPLPDPRGHIRVGLVVFPRPETAAEYVEGYDGEYIYEGPNIPTEVEVAVPGWPAFAYYWNRGLTQHISYRFQHGPAAVTVHLDVPLIGSQEDLAERLGVTLDILQAALAEETPVDD